MLMEVFDEEPGTLWHKYGIIGNVMVCVKFSGRVEGVLTAGHAAIHFLQYFPCANIHELLSLDILHQVIKGAFKDNLVDWVVDYLHLVHSKTAVKEILADINHR